MSVLRRIMMGGFNIEAFPSSRKIYYTASNKITPKENSLGSKVQLNIYNASTMNGVLITANDITSIEGYAFDNCSSLTSITIPDSVTSIGNYAFCYCESLTSISIPNSVITIGNSAFAACYSLTSVNISNNVTTIGSSTFRNCDNLTSIVIPNSVNTIGDSAFTSCDNLTEFKGKFASEDGRCLIVDGVLNSFAPYGLAEYTIPNSVTTIGDYAFSDFDRLISITIPDNVTTIGKSAFYGCTSLTSVTIPDSVTSIGYSTFYNCKSITSIIIPDSVTEIGGDAFGACDGLDSITIPDKVTEIGKGAFFNCLFTKGSFINNSELDEVANDYWGADIYDIIQDDGLCISDNTVYDCRSIATVVIIPNNIISISNNAFFGCYNLTSVTIPNSVTSIGDKAFYGCSSLKNVTIPNSVTKIRVEIFRNCRSLTSITIGDSVTSIDDYAFKGCNSLTSIYCKATTPPSLDGFWAFYDIGSGYKIYVPTGSVNAYKSAQYWSNYADAIVGYDFENNTVIE